MTASGSHFSRCLYDDINITHTLPNLFIDFYASIINKCDYNAFYDCYCLILLHFKIRFFKIFGRHWASVFENRYFCSKAGICFKCFLGKDFQNRALGVCFKTFLAQGRAMCSVEEALLCEQHLSEGSQCSCFSLFRAYREHLEG